MTAFALYGLICLAIGFAAGWVACWTGGLFETPDDDEERA